MKTAPLPPPPGFVLDCSVTMAWFFTDERSGHGEAVLRQLTKPSAVVPALWHLEVANVFVQAERRKRSTPAQAAFDGRLKDAAVAAGVALFAPP